MADVSLHNQAIARLKRAGSDVAKQARARENPAMKMVILPRSITFGKEAKLQIDDSSHTEQVPSQTPRSSARGCQPESSKVSSVAVGRRNRGKRAETTHFPNDVVPFVAGSCKKLVPSRTSTNGPYRTRTCVRKISLPLLITNKT